VSIQHFFRRRIKHSAWLYMLRFIATFLTNWHITSWQHNTSINRNKIWNSYLVCVVRHCSPACLVHNFRCQWYTVENHFIKPTRKSRHVQTTHMQFHLQPKTSGNGHSSSTPSKIGTTYHQILQLPSHLSRSKLKWQNHMLRFFPYIIILCTFRMVRHAILV
jgi:hypothetical protein